MKQQINLNRYLPKTVVNLLPLKTILVYWGLLCLILVVPSIYVMLYYNHQASRLNEIKQQKQKLAQDFVVLKNKYDHLLGEEKQAQSPDMSQFRQKLQQLRQNSSLLYSHYLVALGKYTPQNVWLTNIEISKGGNFVKLRGKALSYHDVTVFTQNLNKSQAFKNKNFETLNIDQSQDNQSFVLATQ